MSDDLKFWLLIGGFTIIACAFFVVMMKIVDRRKNWSRCTMCGWQGELSDSFDCCPECGYYNWENDNG